MEETENILGEEAFITICEHCGKYGEIDTGVVCEGCGCFLHRHICWPTHWCGKLTDRNGLLVKEGSVLRYYSNKDRIYRVTEIPGTFKNVGLCYADRFKKVEYHIVIRPRLMELIPEEGK